MNKTKMVTQNYILSNVENVDQNCTVFPPWTRKNITLWIKLNMVPEQRNWGGHRFFAS